jgi:hypothetical protein
MKSHRVVVILAFVMILTALVSNKVVWATPEQSPDRQTVPSRTPTVPTPVPPPPKEDKNTPVPPTATVALTTLPQTLPPAGTVLTLSPLGPVVVGLLLAVVGWLMRRKAVR